MDEDSPYLPLAMIEEAIVEPDRGDDNTLEAMAVKNHASTMPSDDARSAMHLAMTDRAQFVSFLATFDTNEKYCILTSVAERILHVDHLKNDMSDFLETTARRLGCHEMMNNDKRIWDDMKEFAKKARDDRDRKARSMQRVSEMWPKADIQHDFAELVARNAGSTTWRALHALSIAAHELDCPYERVKMLILKAQINRLSNRAGKRGTRLNVGIEAQDLNAARKMVLDRELVDMQALELELSCTAYGVAANGFIVKAGTEHDIGMISAPSDKKSETDSGSSKEPQPTVSDKDPTIDTSASIQAPVTSHDTFQIEGFEQTKLIDLSSTHSDVIPINGANESTGIIVLSSNNDRYASDHQDFIARPHSRPPLQQAALSISKSIDSSSSRTHQCGCDSRIPITFVRKIRKEWIINHLAQTVLIKTWRSYRHLRVCYRHTRLIVVALGMKGSALGHAKLNERLEAYYQAVINSNLGELKTASTTYWWFRRHHRPARIGDRLGPYKYFHNDNSKIHLTIDHQKDLCKYLGIDHDQWTRDGTINTNCFEWWKTTPYPPNIPGHETLAGRTIYDIAIDEFDMYSHHLRQIEGKANYGWLRTMFFSLAQQAVRQDPKYFMMYCALRDDRNTNLISYPYYTKFQHKGDSTQFRHIDINIPHLHTSARGANQIQGSVSLDDEAPDDCTEIVPGMHHHFNTWAATLVARGAKLGADIHSIGPEEFTRDDAVRYGTDWTTVPCKALQVRISKPQLPHGAQGPAKRVRRTILPWFVALQDDLQTLEVTESGTFDMLSRAHRDLMSAPRTPSGHPNKYGNIQYAFPAAVKLTGLGNVSESLVAQDHPANPAVVEEKKLLWLGTDVQRDLYLKGWRENAVKKVVELFEDVKRFERDAFGEKSFWYRRENGVWGEPVVCDPDPGVKGKGLRDDVHGDEDESDEDMDREVDIDLDEDI